MLRQAKFIQVRLRVHFHMHISKDMKILFSLSSFFVLFTLAADFSVRDKRSSLRANKVSRLHHTIHHTCIYVTKVGIECR